MANSKKIYSRIMVGFMVVCFSCAKDSDPNPNPGPGPGPGGGGQVTITGVSSGYHFWGDEMEINGSGFSTVKEQNIIKFTSVSPTFTFCNLQYTSEAGGAIEIISATATQLKIKVPLKLNIAGKPECGPEKANLEITVNGKKGTFNGVTFGALPYIGNFLYHYGWYDLPTISQVGDSVMIDGGILSFAGNPDLMAKVRLHVNGAPVPIKRRSFGVESGWAFILPPNDYAEINCDTDPDGWGARNMSFTISLEGTGKSATTDLMVQYLPHQDAHCTDCVASLSKSVGGNTEWKVAGTNMYYNRVRFQPTCEEITQDMNLAAGTFVDHLTFAIPLSILTPGCTYFVLLVDHCDGTKVLGQITITP